MTTAFKCHAFFTHQSSSAISQTAYLLYFECLGWIYVIVEANGENGERVGCPKLFVTQKITEIRRFIGQKTLEL